MGPARQQVREFCPTPSNAEVQQIPSMHPKAETGQKLMPPGDQLINQGTDEEPTHSNSLIDTVPQDPNERWLETKR